MRRLLAATLGIAVMGLASAAFSKEYPIGTPHKVAGMEVAAVYLQPIEMDPPGMMRDAKDSDVHLEADIKAMKDNTNGYAEGDWIGYLVVTYEMTKVSDSQILKGDLMPMVANDGPHYGDNVKLLGPGKYKLKLTIRQARTPTPISDAISTKRPVWARGSKHLRPNMNSHTPEPEKRALIRIRLETVEEREDSANLTNSSRCDMN